MSKIRFLVMGISEKELGGLIGSLIMGESDNNAEVMVCPTTPPKVYSIDGAGTARPIDFDRFLSQVVTSNRRQRAAQGPVEKAVQDVVKEVAANASQSKVEIT